MKKGMFFSFSSLFQFPTPLLDDVASSSRSPLHLLEELETSRLSGPATVVAPPSAASRDGVSGVETPSSSSSLSSSSASKSAEERTSPSEEAGAFRSSGSFGAPAVVVLHHLVLVLRTLCDPLVAGQQGGSGSICIYVLVRALVFAAAARGDARERGDGGSPANVGGAAALVAAAAA